MKKILVFIPVAGKGTRMYPFSLEIPKHELPINKEPLEEYILRKVFSLPINKYEVEVYKNSGDPPKGTAWSFCKIPHLKQDNYDHVIVWYGDIYSEVNIRDMLDFHEKNNSCITFLSRKVTSSVFKKGLYETNEILGRKVIWEFSKGNHYVGWNPIKKWFNKFKNPYQDLGVLIISREGINYILNQKQPKVQEYDLSTHIFPQMIERFMCYAYAPDVFTEDIGTPEKYMRVICHVRKLDYDKLKEEMK